MIHNLTRDLMVFINSHFFYFLRVLRELRGNITHPIISSSLSKHLSQQMISILTLCNQHAIILIFIFHIPKLNYWLRIQKKLNMRKSSTNIWYKCQNSEGSIIICVWLFGSLFNTNIGTIPSSASLLYIRYFR